MFFHTDRSVLRPARPQQAPPGVYVRVREEKGEEEEGRRGL